MPPKGRKKKPETDKPNTGSTETNWGEPIEEQSWRACVSMVVGRSLAEETLMEALAAAVPQRQLFTAITRESVLAKISDPSNGKGKKSGDAAMFPEVFDAAKAMLDSGQEVSCDLMAKILKVVLLQFKTGDQRKTTGEAKSVTIAVESKEEKDKSAKPASKGKGASKGSDKKGSAPPAEPEKVKETKLKRRSDVDPPIFKDDEPQDGPQLYVLLLGFYQPQLIELLDAVGVRVANVIQLCSEQALPFQAPQERPEREASEQSLAESSAVDEEKLSDIAQQAERAKNLDLFWTGLKPLLDSGPLNSKIPDVVRLSYTAPDASPPSVTGDPEAVPEFGSGIFDGVANLIFECLKWRRQHQHYRDKLKLIHVPLAGGMESHQPEALSTSNAFLEEKKSVPEDLAGNEAKVPFPSTKVDMCHYISLMERIPPEACSVPLIFNSMLEQVVVSTEQSQSEEEPQPSEGPEISQQLVDYVVQGFTPLMATEEEKSNFSTNMQTLVQTKEDEKPMWKRPRAEKPQQELEHPLIQRHHDERALRLGDVNVGPDLNPAEDEISMMRFCPLLQLIQSFKERNSSSCWLALKQQLQQSCTDDEFPWPQVERLFHQSVFEAMPLTTLDQLEVTPEGISPPGTTEEAGQHTPMAIPWDDPLSYAKQLLQKHLPEAGPAFLTEDATEDVPADATEERSSRTAWPRLDLRDVQRFRLRSLSNWHYVEQLDATIVPQVLLAASEQYLCVDIFRGSHNGTLYVFFHNPMNLHHQCKESWNVALHTDVGFRTYLEHVADTISGWTRKEELKYEAKQVKTYTRSPEGSETYPEVTETEEQPMLPAEEEAFKPVCRKGSLKEWKMEQDRLKEEELAKKTKKDGAKGKGKEAKGSKKGKAAPEDQESRPETAATGEKTLPESDQTAAAPVEEKTEQPPTEEEAFNGFIGYRMDGQLIHVSGSLHHIFPSGGGHISVEKIDFVRGSHLMKVAVMKDGHSFFTHINSLKPRPQPQDTQITDANDDRQVLPAAERLRLKQGCFSAVLDSGVRLSYSFYGPQGECAVTLQETENGNPTTSAVVSAASSPATHSPDGTDIKTEPCGAEENQVCEGEPAAPPSPFRSLNLSVPNGLVLTFLLDDCQGAPPEEKSLLVRQSFPLHGSGDFSHHQDSSLSKELFRTITDQGAVIRYLEDGSTEVLFADGTVSFSQNFPPEWLFDSDEQEEDRRDEGKNANVRSSEADAETPRVCWLTITPSGDRICTVGASDKHKFTTPLLSFKATDFFTHQVMLTREDHVIAVQNPDGSLIVQHVDGTRITCLQQDGDDDGTPVKEQTVMVEKEGCATVIMYPKRHVTRVLLADGTVITGNNQGEYQVFPAKAGLLHVHNDGTCVYHSDQPVTPCLSARTPTDPAGIYTMSHTDKVACDITDFDGNHFQVMEDGQVCVLNFNPAPSSRQNEEERNEDEERETEESRLCVKDLTNLPRLFLVNGDGSGVELLNSHSVAKLLDQAYSDSTIALLKEPLSNSQSTNSNSCPGDFGITLLKPSSRSVWSQWLRAKQIPDITPPNLRNRCWHDFSNEAKKTSGPPFGTDLSLWSRCTGSVAQPQPVRSCPEFLEVRELSQHWPFTPLHKKTVDSRLKDFIQNLMVRELQCEEMQIKDPRTEEESAYAHDLLRWSLSFAEEDDAGPSCHERMSAADDVASRYRRGLGTPNERSEFSEESSSSDSQEGITVEKSTDSRWTKRIAEHREELQEEKFQRAALKRRDIVPYFNPENKQIHQRVQHRKLLSTHLPEISKSVDAESFQKDSTQESKESPRPLNFTLCKSASHTDTKSRTYEKRPSNPTPQSSVDTSRKWNPLELDVTGKPRKTKVRLPTSILSEKPKRLPNETFLTVDDPARRRCRSVSLIDPGTVMRGFELLPASVDFGMVPDATSTTMTVVMRNVGIDTCRFRVQQPPLTTGLRVIYNPGPVPAGLHVELQVQLFTVHVTQVEHVSHDIVINTETEILYLPVVATILPKAAYDAWKKNNTKAQKK